MKPTIVGIDHLVLRTDNLEAMLVFYCDVLGCEIVRDEREQLGLVQLQAGSELIDLLLIGSEMGKLGGGAPTQYNNNLDHFCLRLRPISPQALCRYLRQRGIEVPNFERRNGAEGFGDSIYIKDPDGNTVELKSALQ